MPSSAHASPHAPATEPTHAAALRGAVVAVLEQGLDLLAMLDADAYRTKMPQAFSASIGGHFRHCLEHFEILLACRDGRIDYDARRRDERTEMDPAHAERRTRELLQLARDIDPSDFGSSVMVSSQVSSDASGAPTVPSTLAREAMYAVAHAIHHYALIAVMCRLQEIVPPPGFGIAPSTLQHHAARAAG